MVSQNMGIVFSRDLGCSKEKLLEELKQIKVVAVKHFEKKADSVEKSIPVLLTFETLVL